MKNKNDIFSFLSIFILTFNFLFPYYSFISYTLIPHFSKTSLKMFVRQHLRLSQQLSTDTSAFISAKSWKYQDIPAINLWQEIQTRQGMFRLLFCCGVTGVLSTQLSDNLWQVLTSMERRECVCGRCWCQTCTISITKYKKMKIHSNNIHQNQIHFSFIFVFIIVFS